MASSGQELDSEAVAAFRQLREKIILSHRARAKNDETLLRLERSIQHKKLLLAEMSTLPPETVTYKNVGKAYILTEKQSVVTSYESDFKDAEQEIQKRKADKEAYTKQISGAEGELRELLSSNAALAKAVAADASQ